MPGDLFVVVAADQEAWLETEGPAADQDEETQACLLYTSDAADE